MQKATTAWRGFLCSLATLFIALSSLSSLGQSCDIVTNDITLSDGTTSTSICVDGNPDPLSVTTNGGTGGNNVATGWIITDGPAGNVLGTPASGPFNLDPAGPGTCYIYYVRWEMGDFSGLGVNNIADLTGCFDLSNFIEVIREVPDGGTVTLADGSTAATFTAGNVVFDVAHTTTAPNLSYWYIITDDQNSILGFQNSTAGTTLDLSAAPPGVCRIWGWSYRGLGDPVVGDNISTLADDDCEDISDSWVTITRENSNNGGNQIDLELGIGSNVSEYTIFEDIVYTVSLTNSGSVAANNVTVSVPLPTGTVFSGSNGSFDLFDETWTVPTLAPGATTTIELNFFPLVNDVDLTVFAEVTGAEESDVDSTPANGPNGEDDEATITLSPVNGTGGGGGGTGGGDPDGSIDLELSISTDQTVYEIYTNVVYTITLTNNGTDTANDVVVSAGLPSGTVHSDNSVTGGDYSLFFEEWTVPSLAAGASETLTLNVFTLVAEPDITNFVEVVDALQQDVDSTPNNGNGITPNEDDEAVVTVTGSAVLPTSPVNFVLPGTGGLSMGNLYPNPVMARVRTLIGSERDEDATLQVSDQFGRIVETLQHHLYEGTNEVELDLRQLPAGQYRLTVRTETGLQQTKQFVKYE